MIEGLAVWIGPDAVVLTAAKPMRARYGGLVNERGWSIARAAGAALDAGIRGWQERSG